MAFEVPSYEEVLALEVAFARNRMPWRDWSSWKDNYKRLQVNAGAVSDLHNHLKYLGKEGHPKTATLRSKGGLLNDWGELRSVTQKTATPASGSSAGLVTGTAGSTWTTADTLTHPSSGLQFRPTSGGTVPAAGRIAVGIIALEAGSAGALASGEALEWDSTPAGLDDQIELQTALDDSGTGEDEEDEDAYRVRVLAGWKQQAAGGSPADYRNWILSADNPVSGVEFAYVWRGRNGKGTVDVAGLRSGSGSARLLDAGERSSLLSYLEPLVPCPEAIRVLEVIAEAVDIEYTIQPEDGVANARDWDDTGGLTVSSYTAATRTLVLSANRPASLKVGHRIVVDGTPGAQLTVQALSGANAVVLKSDLGYTISATEEVYSGGGAIKAARDAILALLDALGPRRGDYAATTLSWFSTLATGRLFEAVQTATGVLDSTAITPTSDVEPTAKPYPDDTEVNLLVPGNVIVRYA